MRLVFMGSPPFAARTLAALAEAGQEIAGVYCRAPREAGRGRALQKTAVHELADSLGFLVRHPDRLTAPECLAEFSAFKPDLAIVVAYGRILPSAFLAVPRWGAVNIHASLLPRWRGAAPIERAILAGDAETGITLMQMDEGLDTGPILATRRLPIPPDADAGALREKLAALGAETILAALPDLAEGRLSPRPQPETGITYAAKISPAEARLDWSLPAALLHRHIRAFAPKPGAWTLLADGERAKILAAAPASEMTAHALPGTILDEAGHIACGEGALRLLRLQRAGRQALDWAEFQRGATLAPGARLT